MSPYYKKPFTFLCFMILMDTKWKSNTSETIRIGKQLNDTYRTAILGCLKANCYNGNGIESQHELLY